MSMYLYSVKCIQFFVLSLRSFRSEIYCLGCGVDLPNANRRALSSSDAEDVWKIFIDNDKVEEEVVDRILSGGDSQRLPKMYKKCFTAYKTCHK